MAWQGTAVHAAPDGNAPIVATLKSETRLCANELSEGYGFRRVRLADGSEGFISDGELH